MAKDLELSAVGSPSFVGSRAGLDAVMWGWGVFLVRVTEGSRKLFGFGDKVAYIFENTQFVLSGF